MTRSIRGVCRFIGTCALLLVLNLPLQAESPAQSAEANALLDAADWLPPVDLFAVTRADAGTVAALDALVYRVTEGLPDAIGQPVTLSELITAALLPDTNIDAGAVLTTLIGDEIAVGVDLLNALDDGVLTVDDAVIVYAVAPVRSRPLVESALLIGGLLRDAQSVQQGDFTLYTLPAQNRAIALSDSLIYLVDGGLFVPTLPEETLAQEPDFKAVTGSLNTQTATALFYGATGRLIRDIATDPAIQEIFAALGLEIRTLGPVAGAFTLIGDASGTETLRVDLAQSRRAPDADFAPPVNPDFAVRVPADSDVFVHTGDINRLLTTASGLIASISGSTTGSDIYAQFETLSNLLLSLDLRADILPLLAGDYGLFARAPQTITSADDLHAGVLLTINDASGAQALIDAAAAAIDRLSDDVTIGEGRIIAAESGEAVSAVIASYADPTLGLVEIAAAVNGDTLFIATLDAALSLLDGGESLLDDSAYIQARTHFLPGTALTAYLADRAPGALIRLGFDLLDPVGALFGQEQTDIIVTSAPDYFTTLISSSAISAAESPNGDLLLRLTITLDALTPDLP